MSELVDTNTTYADANDVEFYIRKNLPDSVNSNQFELDDEKVNTKIKENSQKIDKKIKTTAFRERRKKEQSHKIDLTLEQEKSLEGQTFGQSRFGRRNNGVGDWIRIIIKKEDIRQIEEIKIDAAEQVENLDASDYELISGKDGEIRVKLSALKNLTNNLNLRTQVDDYIANIFNDRLYITYTYGKTSVKDDIKKACAMYTAADIIKTDYYGQQIPSDSDITLRDVAKSLEKDADEIVEKYK